MLIAKIADYGFSFFWEALSDLLLFVILLIGGYLIRQVNRILERRKVKEHQLEFNAQTDRRIRELLLELRIEFDADRCYLSQFHNGDYTVADNPILRKTRTHEVVKEGRAYQSEIFKGMLISNVTEEIDLVLDDGPSFTAVASIPPSKFRWLCEEAGIGAVARCAVRKHGKVIGFVGADFEDHGAPPANIHLLCEVAHRIESII